MAHSFTAATATVPWASMRLTLTPADGSRIFNRTADALVEGLKAAYVEGEDLPVELFEEQIDAILRYRHRIVWCGQRSAHVDLRGAELERYPILAEGRPL